MEGRKNLPGQGSSEQGEQKVEAAAMEDEELLGCRSPDFSLFVVQQSNRRERIMLCNKNCAQKFRFFFRCDRTAA
jgi:hypothetical protein